MTRALRVLIVEDSEPDTLLLVEELRRGGFEPAYERVQTAATLRAALERQEWEVILTDNAMPQFDAAGALEVLRQSGRDIPLLLVSGTIEAEHAVALLKAGAHDYVNKRDLSRLVPALERELRQAESNRQRRRAEEELRLLGTAVSTAANAIFITNQHGEILWTNAAFQRLSGYTTEELLGRCPRILRSGVHPPSFYEQMWRTMLAGEVWSGEVVERRKDGALYTVQQTVTPLHDKEGRLSHFVAIHEDITRRKEAEARVEYLAYHDALTGLPNRTLFEDRLKQAILQARRNARLLALLFVDLDQFKIINDTLGHAAGDQFLQEVAQRLHSLVRATDSVARLGGDEFVIIQTDLANVDGAARLASKILHSLAGPYVVHGQELHATASIGITVYPPDDPQGSRLLENADLAMYRAKSEGRNRYAFFTPSLHAEVQLRRELEEGLEQALARQQLLLHYQPQVDLNTGALVGMEALVRWQHPTRGLLLPASFLQAAETSGLIVPLSNYVVKEACAQGQAWQREFGRKSRLAINISATHLPSEALLGTITQALSTTGLDAGSLELEVTETALLRDEQAAGRTIRELARHGVRFSIDDFGTGYSSLKYLKQLAVQELKIDQSFVHNLPHDPDDAVIVRAMIALGHQLGLRVIAEGIETADQLAFLRAHQCDEGQGYYFAPPMTVEAMSELLKRGGPLPVLPPFSTKKAVIL